jgi:hypothetical protein
VLIHDFGAAFCIVPRTPRHRLYKDLHIPGIRYGEQSEAKKPAKLPGSRVGFSATTPRRRAYGQPDLIAGGRTVDGLQDQLKCKAEL